MSEREKNVRDEFTVGEMKRRDPAVDIAPLILERAQDMALFVTVEPSMRVCSATLA
jgi:hypothetical protein